MNKKSDENNFTVKEDAIRQIVKILQDTGMNNISYEDGNVKISVHKFNEIISSVNQHSVTSQPAPTVVDANEKDNLASLIKSPMVGTVYLSSEPGAPNFIKVGDIVQEGQTLLIIEAMKVMNPIKSPRSGKVTKIVVKDAEPVEFDGPLLFLE